ncbi:uncharacterized protein LOC119740163 isoform X1 [Patiria miniata]|uniref:Uncharacterized protein n=1 Tax=Patiria miniata TaxID=46514 RepID=A0A914B667_PATMI|nr:uncharacterized protein LOC119740163 isoform X1 [Patiria miniata]
MHRSQKLANEGDPALQHQLQLAKMRVSDLERTEAHLHSRIQELEDQLAQLQEDIHLGLAERNRERTDLEAEITSWRENSKELTGERDEILERLRDLEVQQETLLEEGEKLQKKLKKKEQAETNLKRQIEKLTAELSALHEITSPSECNNTNESNNKATMENSQDVNALQQKVQQLELVKESLEAKLRDVEELVLNSDFSSEESLRDKIAELEQANKLLTRQLKQSQASDVDSKEVVEKAVADARDTEKALQGRIQELQQSEQSLLDRVAQLEVQDSAWRSQVDSLQDRVQEFEEMRQQLKGKLDEAEERIEELQVAEKFARDELSASHGASSFLGESLGLMGELASLAEEEYVEVEEEDVLELLPESQEPKVQELPEEKDEGDPEKEYRIAQLEKSETELMEKVQVLEQSNVELDDLCQELKSQALECAEENETLKQKLQELEELQAQIPEMVRVLEEAEEEKMALKEMVKELESEVEHLKRGGSNKDMDQNDLGSKEDERELEKELEAVKEENLDLSDKLTDEHRKLQELRRANEQLKEQLQFQTLDDQNLSETTERHEIVEELQQELLLSKSEKAQLEEQLQTECKELKSVINALQASKEKLEQQLESSEYELSRLEEISSELHLELEHRIEDLEREKEELEKHLEEALEQKHNSYTPESEKFLQEQIQLENENQDLLQKLASAEEECSKLQERIGLMEQGLQEQKSELKVARKDSMRRSLECGDSTRELADVKKRLKELEDVESQFFDQTEVLSKMEKETKDLKRQIEDTEENRGKITSLNDQLDAQNQELHELRETITDLKDAKENLQDKLDVEAELLEETSEKLEMVQSEFDTAKEELNLQREKLEQAGERVHDLEGQLSKLEELENENQKLQSIVNASTVSGEDEELDSKESLKLRVTELTEREEELQLQISELEERQLAYEETIAQADLIVSETHQKLSDQNELLEAKERELQNLRDQLESGREEEVSHKLQLLDDTTHELERKNKQLEVGEEKLKELMNSVKVYEEKCQLKEEKLQELEQEEIRLASKMESLQEPSSPESQDIVEPVIQAHTAATQDSASAPESSSDAAALADKIQVMKQNEEALQQRIEHFQERQAAFEETLAQADVMLTESKQKLDDRTKLSEIQENELLELKENIAHLKEEKSTFDVACAENLEKKSRLLEETSQELKMKSEELNKLRDELEMLTQNLESSNRKCKDLEERLQGLEHSEIENEHSTSEEESVASLRKKIANMTNHEETLQQKIIELEERQSAFEETLAQADVIMTERESGFVEQISELQSSHSDLQEKLRRVSESKKQGLGSQSSDEDEDKGTEEFSVFSPDATADALEVERNNSGLEEEIAKLKGSEQELLKVVENYKTLEKTLRSTNDELQEQLDLVRDKIKQLENALEERGPDNDLQAQLEELKTGVQLHEETNLRLKEEITNLKETIANLQDQLLQSPNQQISEDGFIKPGTLTDEDELIKPQIVVTEEAQVPFELDLKQTIGRLEQEVNEAKNQLKDAEAARDSLKAEAAEKDATVERLEKANVALQDDIDITTTRIEELEQQLSQISQENNNVTSSQRSQSQSEEIVKELQDTIQVLQNKLETTEKVKPELQKDVERTAQSKGEEGKELNKTEQLRTQELEKSVEWFKKEMASANSERVKTTNRLTEIVQFNREIKKDLRELEESEKILRTDNSRLKQEKDLLNEKLSTFGICGEDLLKELMTAQGTEEVADMQDGMTKRKVGYQPSLNINKGCQTGPLTYIPNECLLATILIEDFEMTLKEFLEALPHGHSPTDPVLLKEGKNFFVEFNKLFIGKCRTPRARLLRGLSKKLPVVKPQPERVKKKPIYPSMPGEECFKEQGGSEERKLRPLEAASPTSRKRMVDEFVAALWDLPWEIPPDVDWDNASIWYPNEEEMEEDSIDASECRQVEEEPTSECRKELVVELETLPPALPESTLRKRTGSMSSDSLSGDPPPLPEDSPPRRVIRNDSLEVEDEEKPDDKEDLPASPPPLPASSPPRKPDSSSQSPNQPGGIISSFRSPSFESRSETDNQELPPPLPKTSPPGKPKTSTAPSNRDQWRSSLTALYSDSQNGPPDIRYQTQQASVSTDPESDASSSTDTLTDHETCRQDVTNDKNSGPKGDHRDGAARANSTHRPASFDSGLDTVSSITEQEVEAITAASVFAGPDHSLRLPRAPGTPGTSLAKPATPMWLKQMMDWQTADKEKEETDLGRLKTSIDTMEKQLQEKEEVVKELRQSEESLKKKLRDFGDLRPLKLQLQTKDIDLQDRERQVALLKSEVRQREREVNSLQTKLEQSQESLRAKEQELKSKEDEEGRAKEEIEKKERELSSKEEALEKQSEELKNLEAAVKEHQQHSANSTDHADAARSRDMSSHDTSPDSRPGEAKSHDSRAHELHLSSALDVLTRENEELRGRAQRLATMEDRWAELQEQLAESRHSNRDQDALQRKLHMAEEMLREKTSEELHLAEDNAALEDRVRHLEEQKRKREGIEEDYICIKEQFDDMEHKKNEAEISVAPLKAKVSYLLQKCKERDTIIRRFAAELEQLRPDRTEQLLTEVSDLSAVDLPDERFNEPLPVDGRGRRVRGAVSEASKDRRRRGGDIGRQRVDKISKSLNDVRMDDLSDDDELGRLSTSRGRSSLDPLSGSLDNLGPGISLQELMKRTSGSRSRSHLTPSREAEEADLLRSVLDASPTRTKPATRLARGARSPSRGKRRGISPTRNDLSREIHDAYRDDGLLDLSNRGSPSRARPQDFVDPLTPSTLRQSPLFSSRQQERNRQPFQFDSSSGNVDDFSPSPEGIRSSPTVSYPGTNVHPSLLPSSLTINSTPLVTAPSPARNPLLQSQPWVGHQTLNSTQGQAYAATTATQSGNVKSVNGPSTTSTTSVTHNGAAFGLLNGSVANSNLTAPGMGTVRGTTGQHPVASESGLRPVTDQPSPANDAMGFNTGRLQTGSGMSQARPENTASKAFGSAAVHPGIPVQAGRSVHGAVGDFTQPRESIASGVPLTPNGHSLNVVQAGNVSQTPMNRRLGLDQLGSSRQGVDAPAVHHGKSSLVAHPATEETSGLPTPSLQQINTVSGTSQPHVSANASNIQPGVGSSITRSHLVSETSSGFPTFGAQQINARSGTSQPAANVPNVQPGLGSPITRSHLVSETPLGLPTSGVQQHNAGHGTSQPGANVPNVQPGLGSPIAQSHLVSQTSAGLPTLGAQQIVTSGTSQSGQVGVGASDFLRTHPVSGAPLVSPSVSTHQTNGVTGTSHPQFVASSAASVQPEVGSSNLHAGFRGHVNNTSHAGGSNGLPQHHVVSTSAMHHRSLPSGFASQASVIGLHQQGIPYMHTNQQQSANTTILNVTSGSQNGHVTLSPSSAYPSSTSHNPMMPLPGNGHMTPTVPAAGTQIPRVPSNNFSSTPLIASTGLHPSHHAAPSNGTPLHHHNLLRGVDVPDQSGARHHGIRTQVNGRWDQHLPFRGVTRTPHVQGAPQPPRSLTVSKVIGRHGAVVTWRPPDLDDLGQSNGLEVVGYKIFVDGRQKQFVTNAHLTKALVEGVNLRTVQSFGIQTVSATGQTSPIVSTHFEDPGHLSSSWSDSVMTVSSVGRGAVPSDGSSVVSEESQERLFMAVYNYNPIEHSPNHYPTYELAFEEGDIITVYGTIRPDGFYQGKVRGTRGLVPSNFIEEISMAGSHHSKKKHGHKKSHRNGMGDTHSHRDGDRRGSKEHSRTPTKTPTKTPSKNREDHKRHGSSNQSRI